MFYYVGAALEVDLRGLLKAFWASEWKFEGGRWLSEVKTSPWGWEELVVFVVVGTGGLAGGFRLFDLKRAGL